MLLGQQLEGQGLLEAAASARAIGVELRDVAGELRLPLLDDLGVGPALDWLADRVLPLAMVAEGSPATAQNLGLIRTRDQVIPYMYLPRLPGVLVRGGGQFGDRPRMEPGGCLWRRVSIARINVTGAAPG